MKRRSDGVLESWSVGANRLRPFLQCSTIPTPRAQMTMSKNVFRLALCAMLLAICDPVHAQQVKERKIAVIGAPEEPRFSEVVAGLKKGLSELGYTAPSLLVQEVKIARSEEKGAKSVVEGLLRQQAQVLFLI